MRKKNLRVKSGLFGLLRFVSFFIVMLVCLLLICLTISDMYGNISFSINYQFEVSAAHDHLLFLCVLLRPCCLCHKEHLLMKKAMMKEVLLARDSLVNFNPRHFAKRTVFSLFRPAILREMRSGRRKQPRTAYLVAPGEN